MLRLVSLEDVWGDNIMAAECGLVSVLYVRLQLVEEDKWNRVILKVVW